MASDETTQGQEVVECDLCQNPVSFYCRRCGVNICDACIPEHLRVKSKTGHDVVDYVSKDDDDTCFCDSHPEHECSAFCRTCDAPICMLCVSIKHRSHTISDLSDKINELLKSITSENDRLQSFRHELEKNLNDTTEQLSSLSSVYMKGKDEVTARGEEWHKLIGDYVNKLHQQLDELRRESETVLQKQKQEFQEMINQIDEINTKSTQLQKSKNVTEMQKFKPVIEEQNTMEEFTQYTTPLFYACKLDENFWQAYFGFIKKIQEKKIILRERKHVAAYAVKMLEIPLVSSIIVSGFPADKEDNNRLYDMAVTDDEKVWMGGHSNELKLFDLQGNLQRTVNISDIGMYICMYNKEVVFSDSNDKTVKKVSDDNKVETMFQTREWIIKGITGSSSGDLLVCLHKNDQCKVVRYSSTGTVLQEIQYDSQGQPLYQAIGYIAENVNGDIIVTDHKKVIAIAENVTGNIIVNDYKKEIVIAVDKRGIFRYSYSGKDGSFCPSAIATDSIGHVFVTDFYDKIHMLDKDGRFMSYIVPEEGIEAPRAVCVIGYGEIMVGESLTGLVKRIKYLDK